MLAFRTHERMETLARELCEAMHHACIISNSENLHDGIICEHINRWCSSRYHSIYYSASCRECNPLYHSYFSVENPRLATITQLGSPIHPSNITAIKKNNISEKYQPNPKGLLLNPTQIPRDSQQIKPGNKCKPMVTAL
jgi:hypothetical protein